MSSKANFGMKALNGEAVSCKKMLIFLKIIKFHLRL